MKMDLMTKRHWNWTFSGITSKIGYLCFYQKKTYEYVNIYDCFAGPGRDTDGNQGSPLIIIEEVKNYLQNESVPKADGVKIKLYFNDDKKPKYQELKQNIENCQEVSLFSCEVENKDFKDAFTNKVAELQSKKHRESGYSWSMRDKAHHRRSF